MRYAVIGGGTWGCSLAKVLKENYKDVKIYSIDEESIEELKTKHTNSKYFDSQIIFPDFEISNNLESVISDADAILFAVPSKVLPSVVKQMIPLLKKKYHFINTIKGFAGASNQLVIPFLEDTLPEDKVLSISSLIGPSHAEEVVIKMITLICIVSKNEEIARVIQNDFSNDYFRVYTSNDTIGAEIGASYKNAIAIGSGILDGLGYGDNSRAALITRGLNEMMNYGVFFGADKTTFLGLTGVGDLVVTCNSKHSRNFRFGHEIGRTRDVKKVTEGNKETVEGYKTIESIYLVSKKNNLSTPIIDALYDCIYNGNDAEICLLNLMRRALKNEEDN